MLPALIATVFAEAVPTWTDKEVLITIGSVLGVVLTTGGAALRFLVRMATTATQEKLKKAEARCSELQRQAKEFAGKTTPDSRVVEMEQELKTAKQEAARLADDLSKHKNDFENRLTLTALETQQWKESEAKARESVGRLQTDLENLGQNLEKHEGELNSERNRIRKALRKDGQTWTEKVRSNAPDFKPLDPESRRTPVISVLNLKGGVGKTTLTANLGAALSSMGYRVLLVDLDLQGSLTGLYLSESEQEQLFTAEKLLGDFLAASFDAEFPNLLDYTRPVLGDLGSALVPTTDWLAYAETNLTIRWLLREGNRDPRFLLRKELHFKRVTNKFDIILLDCPPLINVCCVNALAASDYLLIPVMPSKQATARVTVLLERLKEFREHINPALSVMGIVANRTQRAELTAEEHNRLSLLREQCKDRWGQEVHPFEKFIRQNTEVRTAEDENRPLRPEDSMFQAFIELAREVESRLPTFCRPSGAKNLSEVAP